MGKNQYIAELMAQVKVLKYVIICLLASTMIAVGESFELGKILA